ncbi:hypothetical protein A2U01_0046980, partial [Trifolium medium]|nr:hypothetical protein [Trifolium medium]
RTAIADLLAVPSTAHLKLKYYINKGQVATLHGDIEAARRCFDAATNDLSYIGQPPSPSKKSKPTSQLLAPDGEFELVPLGEDPRRGVKIGAGLPELARKQLKPCLRENADLFIWSVVEMLGLDPEVACHQLTVDPDA